MLSVQQLRVNYGTVSALQGVDINVGSGDWVSVVGANGAGKSTLLMTIAGVIKPASGTVTLDDELITGARPEDIVGKGLALVPEGRHIFTRLTVEENLHLSSRIGKQRGQKSLREGLDEIFELFPILNTYRRASADKLSGGEQQMLAIARALLLRPSLLMLDEPSFGLAPLMVDRIFDTLLELKQRGMTILLVEQNAHRAIAFAEHSYVLSGGRVAQEGTCESFTDASRVADVFLGGVRAKEGEQ